MTKRLDAFYAEWLEEFQGESDRACAVLAAALLERALEETFSAFCLDDVKVVDQLLSRLNFYTKIEAAFALGLIGDVERSDLHLIREIRNAFAHQLAGLSFRAPKIKNKCLKLQAIAEIGFPFPRDAAEPTRFRFISAVVFIAETLRDRMKRVTRREKPESMREVVARLSSWGS